MGFFDSIAPHRWAMSSSCGPSTPSETEASPFLGIDAEGDIIAACDPRDAVPRSGDLRPEELGTKKLKLSPGNELARFQRNDWPDLVAEAKRARISSRRWIAAVRSVTSSSLLVRKAVVSDRVVTEKPNTGRSTSPATSSASPTPRPWRSSNGSSPRPKLSSAGRSRGRNGGKGSIRPVRRRRPNPPGQRPSTAADPSGRIAEPDLLQSPEVARSERHARSGRRGFGDEPGRHGLD